MPADIEIESRWQNAIRLRLSRSKLLDKPTIGQFHFNHHKSRKEQTTKTLNLTRMDFISEPKDVIMIGNPGTGQTLLAKGIAHGVQCQHQRALRPKVEVAQFQHVHFGTFSIRRWQFEAII